MYQICSNTSALYICNININYDRLCQKRKKCWFVVVSKPGLWVLPISALPTSFARTLVITLNMSTYEMLCCWLHYMHCLTMLPFLKFLNAWFYMLLLTSVPSIV